MFSCGGDKKKNEVSEMRERLLKIEVEMQILKSKISKIERCMRINSKNIDKIVQNLQEEKIDYENPLIEVLL